MALEKLASAIHNNVMSGLHGATINVPFTLEQVEDGIINERMQIIKEYALKNLIPENDLAYSIRCIKVDCESLDRCPCSPIERTKLKHIEIPQVFTEFSNSGILFVGSTDGYIDYKVYTTNAYKHHKSKRRGSNKPYVWFDLTPNKNNMIDGFIFNMDGPLKEVLVKIVPKDIRQLDNFTCCSGESPDNISFINNEIERRLTEKYIRWYRQLASPQSPNDQTIAK